MAKNDISNDFDYGQKLDVRMIKIVSAIHNHNKVVILYGVKENN